jgi:8-oxo-dGTP pyrophosphatase MutT (NUDIX family)
MRLPVPVRRAAIRCAYAGLRAYWFLFRPRIVGVKCVLVNEREVLLVRHTYGRRSWDLPGGTVRRRELPVDAARREMEEELGRRIEHWIDLGELFVHTNHHDDNLHLFRADLPDRRIVLDLTELSKAAWFAPDALPADAGRYVAPIVARLSGA